MDDDTIVDLNRAEQAVSSLLTSDKQRRQQGYQPKTLQQHNRTRHVYLPLFPTKSFGPNDCLLLANVPVTHLGPHEMARRAHGAYTSDALMLMNNYKYSNNEGFQLSEQDVEDLAARLRVGKSIITFNADHLRGICYSLMALHESFRRKIHYERDVASNELILNSKQMALVLEFYLQIDVDIFYMKTCSFRGAQPRSILEGLFCGEKEPQARYTMLACGNLFCPCCHPPNNWKKTSQPWPVVDFISSSIHQFVNGYTTYLNCPATCHTTNVIYAMTCPCGHYDYVDSTPSILAHAMIYHRAHGNRIIHEKLTGSPLFRGSITDPNRNENEIAKKMRLYQHSARCPSALRSFLDCNPDYWCFIPRLWHEAQTENIIYLQERSSSSSSSVSDTTHPEVLDTIMMGALGNHGTADYLDHVPLPPAVYAFSYQQRQKQRLFFEQFLSSSIQQLPYSALDLYQVAMIAVLPDDRSIILRYIIETLFILHGETKLNMICPLGSDPEQRYGRPYDLVWCANLHPQQHSRSNTTTTITLNQN